ncbi:MAG: hypothetical protein WA628_15185, partial [Terriglobales bacterium]
LQSEASGMGYFSESPAGSYRLVARAHSGPGQDQQKACSRPYFHMFLSFSQTYGRLAVPRGSRLRLLDIKIDYRDGLVDFSYDPKRWGQ